MNDQIQCHPPPRARGFLANVIAALRQTRHQLHAASLDGDFLLTMLDRIASKGGEFLLFESEDDLLPLVVVSTVRPCPTDCELDHKIDGCPIADYLERWAVDSPAMFIRCSPRFIAKLTEVVPEPIGKAS